VEILRQYASMVEPYTLRAGMQIIDIWSEYVVVEGTVCGRRRDGTLGNLYTSGSLIDPSLEGGKGERDREVFVSWAEGNSKLIKIGKQAAKDSSPLKERLTLAKLQKLQLANGWSNQRAIVADPALVVVRESLRRFFFFQRVATYDLNELLTHSRVVVLRKGALVYKPGTTLKRLWFLVTGSVRAYHSVPRSLNDGESCSKPLLSNPKRE
jgi:hypothetical protein